VSDELRHYGILTRSGRYRWGSGGDPYQRSMDFYGYTEKLKQDLIKEGVPKNQLDNELIRLIGDRTGDNRGYSLAELRDTRTIAKEQIVLQQTNQAVKLRDKDWSVEAIAKNLGISEGTVRLRLKNSEKMQESALRKTAEVLRKAVDDNDIVDIGKGVGLRMGISSERLRAASSVLRDEGYLTYNIPVPMVGSKNSTNQLVMVKAGTTWGEARKMADRIHTMGEWSEDDGATFFGIRTPKSIDPKRVKIEYESPEDGVVYVRPGVKDLDMGGNTYAQARIQVGDGHFIKGMAIQSKNIPDGYDLVVHSNKKADVGKLGALKPLKDDPDNPFGSVIKRQILEVDPKTGEQRAKSAINIVNEPGDWDDWRKSLPSQMLAKQPHALIKEQLAVTRAETKARLDEINSITNPVIRKKRLQDYADQIDADAVDLRAAAMPRQKTQVIIPVAGMRDTEVYAPQFKTGERVVLIRYPHGGRFEIPEVVVNNNLRKAKSLLGDAIDAIGISPKTAERLSGADFDGDTVVVIPNPKGKIKGLDTAGKYYQKELDGFDPKRLYGNYQEIGVDKKGNPVGNFPLMKNTGLEMGKITNLITDMQVQGASPEHVVRAVKHSMVVIDAEKHSLDYKRSEVENGIKALREQYQVSVKPDGSPKIGGATTLLSRATAGETIPERKLRPAAQGGAIDPETGALVYVPKGKMRNVYDPKTGTYLEAKVPTTESVKKLALTDDAFTLTRDKNDRVEKMYAEHANAQKAEANRARLQAARIPNPPQNKQARVIYKDEISKLSADLKNAQKQLPLERRAQRYARTTVKMKRDEDPTLRADSDRMKKTERQALFAARQKLGLERPVIEITDRQWDAIQSGAVSPSMLRSLLDYADPKRIETLSMPRQNTVMTSAISARAKAMLSAGATTADVAAALGIPASTLREAAARGDV
jgi:hypothetical protein